MSNTALQVVSPPEEGEPTSGWGAQPSDPRELQPAITPKEADDWRLARVAVRLKAQQLGLSITEVSRRADVAMGTLSSWYSGKYRGSYGNTSDKVNRWLAAVDEQSQAQFRALQVPGFVETPTAREVLNALIFAQSMPTWSLITLGPGMGKTSTARHVVATRPHTYRVVMRSSTGSVHTMLREIANALTVTERDPGKLAAGIGERLKRNGRNTLLMVDEAQFLSDKAVDELRYYMDEFGCGIALLGNADVITRWGRTTPREGYGQLHRRIGPRVDRLRPQPSDISTFVDAWNISDPDVRRLACVIGTRPGALGQITETLKMAATTANGAGRPLSAGDVRDAWRNRSGEELR